MIDFLVSVGFQLFHSCGCNGGEAKFRKEGMIGVTIKLKRRSDSYEILRSNKVINRGMSHQLEPEYNKLFT